MLAAPPPIAAQVHTTGLQPSKTCPVRADDGETVTCAATFENRDAQHQSVNIRAFNITPFFGPGNPSNGSTTDITMNCRIGAARNGTACDGGTAVVTSSFNLDAGDGATESGNDFVCCSFQETVSVGTCNIGLNSNFQDDEISAAGTDGDPSGEFTGLPSTGATTGRVFIDCCGDGAVNQAFETCDTNPQGSVPDAMAECPTCNLASITTECRSPGTANECTICGDGIIQANEKCDGSAVAPGLITGRTCRSGLAGDDEGGTINCTFCGDGMVNGPAGAEQCDDGNTNDNDACTNDCLFNCEVRLDKKISGDNNPSTFVDVADFDPRRIDTAIGWTDEPVLYEFCVANTGGADLLCTLADPLLNLDMQLNQLAPGGETCVQVTNRTCTADIAQTNTATVTCECVDQGGRMVDDEDSADLECQTPDVNVMKDCVPMSGTATDLRDFVITVTNPGTATLVNCTVEDDGCVNAGDCPATPGTAAHSQTVTSIAPGGEAVVTFPDNTITESCCNSTWVTCDILNPNTNTCVLEPGTTDCKTVMAAADKECLVEEELICRTPGFWGTHAEVNPKKARSKDITGAFLPVTVCGITLNNTEPDQPNSAQEALCVSPRGDSILQLARQLTAAQLNCNASGGCGGSVDDLLDDCEVVCVANRCIAPEDRTADAREDIGECISDIDDFNNGIGLAPGCHDEPLPDPFQPPGPAGSSNDCNLAHGNSRTIFTGVCPE